jgi:glyoxylase-like metal-dependent hydrolase (beta-lactamase superfamily II)
MSEAYRFAVGTSSCLAIRDSVVPYPIAMFLTNLSKGQYEPLLRERGQNTEDVELPYTCLLIETGRRRVLVDTGIGVSGSGNLLRLLRSEGIEPEAIDTVIFSHGHPDHVGGGLNGAGKPAFPNARYVMLRKEWDYWMSTPSLAELPVPDDFKSNMLNCAQKTLSGVQSQLDLVHPETEIAPGITALAAFGHSPGQLALEIVSGGERLLFVADAVVLPLHFEFPETIGVTDHVPSEVVATRIKLLEKAAREESLLSTSHFQFPGLGYAVPQGGRWHWRPIEAVRAAQ